MQVSQFDVSLGVEIIVKAAIPVLHPAINSYEIIVGFDDGLMAARLILILFEWILTSSQQFEFTIGQEVPLPPGVDASPKTVRTSLVLWYLHLPDLDDGVADRWIKTM